MLCLRLLPLLPPLSVIDDQLFIIADYQNTFLGQSTSLENQQIQYAISAEALIEKLSSQRLFIKVSLRQTRFKLVVIIL